MSLLDDLARYAARDRAQRRAARDERRLPSIPMRPTDQEGEGARWQRQSDGAWRRWSYLGNAFETTAAPVPPLLKVTANLIPLSEGIVSWRELSDGSWVREEAVEAPRSEDRFSTVPAAPVATEYRRAPEPVDPEPLFPPSAEPGMRSGWFFAITWAACTGVLIVVLAITVALDLVGDVAQEWLFDEHDDSISYFVDVGVVGILMGLGIATGLTMARASIRSDTLDAPRTMIGVLLGVAIMVTSVLYVPALF